MSSQGTSLTPESEGLQLPEGIELLEKVGAGRFNRVYRVNYQGETLALKAYSPRAVDFYRKKFSKNIAVLEMAQNRQYRKVPELVPYTAKPIRVIGQDGQSSLCFLQEFIDGLTLDAVIAKVGHFPGSVMAAGESIDRVCEEKNLDGLDQFMQNVLVREVNGQWLPVLHDFKHVAQPRTGTVSGPSLLSRIGLGRKGMKRPGFLGQWDRLG